jgi:hypothetical protein
VLYVTYILPHQIDVISINKYNYSGACYLVCLLFHVSCGWQSPVAILMSIPVYQQSEYQILEAEAELLAFFFPVPCT